MARKTTRWFLSFPMTLYLLLIAVRGIEDADNAFRNGRNLVLEYFLPINLPEAANVPSGREKRDVEGSGEDDSVFSEISEKSVDDGDNSTQNAFKKLILQENFEKAASSFGSIEGSGEIDEVSESSETSSEGKSESALVGLISETEVLSTLKSDEVIDTTKTPENRSEVVAEVGLTSTEMIFNKSEDFEEISTVTTERTTILATESAETVISINTTLENKEEMESTTPGGILEETVSVFQTVENRLNESATLTFQETTTVKLPATTVSEETTATLPAETTTLFPLEGVLENNAETAHKTEATTTSQTTAALGEEITTSSITESQTIIPALIPQMNISEERTVAETEDFTTSHPTTETTITPALVPSTPKFLTHPIFIDSTEGLPKTTKLPSTPQPIIEEIFKETKIDRKEEALPGNILQKENLSLAADPLLIANTRLMDSEENVQLSSSEPKRLGAYIVIGLILLSFSSLVGYITFKKRMNRKRQELESNQESNDTEKALLSLTDYKDNSELEENHLKNNEITPIVVKSNTQINKFEKNTNFSSPKNLNTIANEKNIEKDNVLKSTAENLTQVIIEDSPKDVEEDKNVPSMEKLIVKTRIDQDSIPKKPIFINRSSTGYLPIPQDNS